MLRRVACVMGYRRHVVACLREEDGKGREIVRVERFGVWARSWGKGSVVVVLVGTWPELKEGEEMLGEERMVMVRCLHNLPIVFSDVSVAG